MGVAGSIVLVKELPLKKETRKRGKAINALVFIDCRRYPAPLSAGPTIRQYFSTGHALTHYSTATVINVAAGFAISYVPMGQVYLFRHAPHQTTTYRIILKKKKKKKLISHNQNFVLFYRVFPIFITKVIQCPMAIFR